jgi:hypothetical protein
MPFFFFLNECNLMDIQQLNDTRLNSLNLFYRDRLGLALFKTQKNSRGSRVVNEEEVETLAREPTLILS